MPINQRADMPGRNDGWNDYMKALQQQNQWFRCESKYSLSVLGETKSYRHTISELRKVAQGDWDTLTEQESKCLLGLGAYKDGWPFDWEKCGIRHTSRCSRTEGRSGPPSRQSSRATTTRPYS